MSRATCTRINERVYVLDNGSYTAKVGHSSNRAPKIIPNCIMKAKSEKRRIFVGDQIQDCRDASGLYFLLPFHKGILANWEVQKTVWDYLFGKDCCPIKFEQSSLIVTEPYFNFAWIQEAMAEIIFEEYEFQSFFRVTAGDLSAYRYRKMNHQARCVLVIDSGFSQTYIAPYILGKHYASATKRLDVGGKLLTNYLKDVVSYRQLHVMEETYVINQVKEDSCFVSQDFKADMYKTKLKFPKNDIVRDYILPDFTNLRRGYLKSLSDSSAVEQQRLRLNNERFVIPEVLFRPSDIGIKQMDLTEAILECINDCPVEARTHLTKNIVLTGGNTKFPGFRERLYKEIRAAVPDHFVVKISCPMEPTTYAWEGGVRLSKDVDFCNMLVTKQEYDEFGPNICLEKCDNFYKDEVHSDDETGGTQAA